MNKIFDLLIGLNKQYMERYLVNDSVFQYFTKLFNKQSFVCYSFYQELPHLVRIFVFLRNAHYIRYRRYRNKQRWHRLLKKKQKGLFHFFKRHLGSFKTARGERQVSSFHFLFVNRFLLCKKRASFDLSKFFKKQCFLNFIFLKPSRYGANVLGVYISKKLRKGYLPGEIVTRFLQDYSPEQRKKLFGAKFSGLLIKCNGRFTRQQRASHSIFNFGSVPKGSTCAKIDYFFFTMPLRFGAVGVHIHLNKGFYKKKDDFERNKTLSYG